VFFDLGALLESDIDSNSSIFEYWDSFLNFPEILGSEFGISFNLGFLGTGCDPKRYGP